MCPGLRIESCTPDMKGEATRVEEIVLWLQQHCLPSSAFFPSALDTEQQSHCGTPPVSLYPLQQFVVLDDQKLCFGNGSELLRSHVVRKLERYGLRLKNIRTAERILQGSELHAALDADWWARLRQFAVSPPFLSSE